MRGLVWNVCRGRSYALRPNRWSLRTGSRSAGGKYDPVRRIGGACLLVEPDRTKRHRLFECSAKPLDAFVAPNHFPRRLDACVDSRSISSPLAAVYDPEQGRPAIPPEVLVRALVIGYAYAIPSFRRLYAAIDEDLAHPTPRLPVAIGPAEPPAIRGRAPVRLCLRRLHSRSGRCGYA